MNKIFCLDVKAKIIILIYAFFVGFCAGANSLQVLEVKEGMATVKVPEGRVLSVDQVLYTEPVPYIEEDKSKNNNDVPKRNGFATTELGVLYSVKVYDFNNFAFAITTGYGEVFGKTEIADAGIFEGTARVSGTFSGRSSDLAVGMATEINFIKNDGINKLIPGLAVHLSLGYVEVDSRNGYSISVGLGAYLKAFVSKQFALIPNLALDFVRYSGSDSSNTIAIKGGSSVILSLGLGLRRYF